LQWLYKHLTLYQWIPVRVSLLEQENYPHCSVLVGSRYGFKCHCRSAWFTIKL